MLKKDLLHREDYVLWETVIRTVRPLPMHRKKQLTMLGDIYLQKMNREQKEPISEEKPKKIQNLQPSEERKRPQKRNKQHLIYRIEHTTYCKIAKEKLDIDARIDLHGLIQSEAYSALYNFLLAAHERKLRYVLVITGKGTSLGSDSVLQRMVPRWLMTSTFQSLVSAYEISAQHHGGEGALYVRLRRSLKKLLSDSRI